MNQRLKDRVAIVVGSTSGIGTTIAEYFAKEGAKVVITGRRKEKGNEVVKKIVDAGYEASFFQIDVQHPEECRALIEDTIKKYSKLDILVN
ncbi:MAG TPA: SDR family NAD(P)-dependent oxidoreductase, partial [Tissierellaceae bacterium]|nr:SDR family NAD(P)-dependent oxidoreductase [Tissierellaceae bacterium]